MTMFSHLVTYRIYEGVTMSLKLIRTFAFYGKNKIHCNNVTALKAVTLDVLLLYIIMKQH